MNLYKIACFSKREACFCIFKCVFKQTLTMKKFTTPFVVVILLLLANSLKADEFEIINFYKDSDDLSAIRFQRTNINGEKCALIKIRTDLSGLKFNANIGVVGDVQKKDGDYWVYVSPGEQRMKFIKEGFISKSYNFPEPIEGSSVYVLKLTNTDNKSLLDENLVKVMFRFNVNKVYISRNNGAPVHSMGKVAEFKLPPGNHSFTFTKNGYQDLKKEYTIEKEDVFEVQLVEGSSETPLDLPGIVTINSKPPGAEVYLNSQKIGVTPFVDQVIAGDYELALKKDLYAAYTGSFSIEEGETKELPLIKLNRITGEININSNAEGATIFIDGKEAGKSPLQDYELNEGQHTIRLEHPDYHTQEHTVQLKKGESLELTVELEDNVGTLIVDSEPQGATVYLDGVRIGNTPLNKKNVRAGKYDLRVEKENLHTETENIIIRDDETTRKMLVLTSNFGTVKITANDAAIYQNDQKVGFGSYEAKLKPGKYIFEARREKFNPDKEEIFLSVGDVRDITLEPQARKGSLSLITEPFDSQGAEIYIDGILQPKTTPAVIPLLIGNYDITLKKEGYADFRQEVIISDGDNKKVVAQMQTYRGSLQEKLNTYKKKKYYWLGASAAFLAGGYFFQTQADSHYESYLISTSTPEATDLHDKVENNNRNATLSYGLSAVALIPAIVNHLKQKDAKSRLQISGTSDSDRLLSLKFKF